MFNVRKIVFVTCVFIASSLVALAGLNIWLTSQMSNKLSINASQLITVEKGQTLSYWLPKLQHQNWFDSALVFKLYLLWHPELAKIKSGSYQFSQQDSLLTLLIKLSSGQEHQFLIQFIEGSQFKQWLAQLNHHPHIQPISDAQLQQLATELNLTHGFEGVLYPETYAFTHNTSAKSIIKRAYQKMQQALLQQWQQKQENLPLKNPYQALILASIIEKETAVAEEYPVIASVFVNRLRKGMRLQTDPTVIYGLGDSFDGDIKRIHLKQKTPYNTYRIKGLPPTPIAMPSIHALTAALHPADTEYLYFVSNGQGRHVFSTNISDHNRAVRRYQLGK